MSESASASEQGTPGSAAAAATSQVDPSDSRRKKQDRFRRHKEKTRSIDCSKRAATPEKKEVAPIPLPTVAPPPPKIKTPIRPSTPTKPRDLRSVTRRRSDGANTGKRDKLVSKLRNKKERFLAPPKPAEEQQQPDGTNQVDSMISSDGGKEDSMHTVESMMSSTDGESSLSNGLSQLDSKVSAVTEGETGKSNAVLQNSEMPETSAIGMDTAVIGETAPDHGIDSTGDDVVDAILQRQMLDDDSDISSSIVAGKLVAAEEKPNRRLRVISQIMTGKLEQMAEVQTEADHLRELKAAERIVEADRVLELKVVEARAVAKEEEVPIPEDVQSPKSINWDRSMDGIQSPPSLEVASKSSVEQEGKVAEIKVDESRASELSEAELMGFARSASPTLFLESDTKSATSSPEKSGVPPQKMPLFVLPLQDSNLVAQSIDELMGSPMSSTGIRSPKSTTQEEGAMSPRSPEQSSGEEVDEAAAAAAAPQRLHVSPSNDEGPGDELMASPRSHFSKASPKSSNRSVSEIYSTEANTIEAGQNHSTNSQTRGDQSEEAPDDESTVSPSESTLEGTESRPNSLAIVQPDEVANRDYNVDELMGYPQSSGPNTLPKTSYQRGLDDRSEPSAFPEIVDNDIEEHEGSAAPDDLHSSVEPIAPSPREQLEPQPTSEHREGLPGVTSGSNLEEPDESSPTEPEWPGDTTTQTLVEGPSLNVDIGTPPPPPPPPKKRRSRSKRKENKGSVGNTLETIEGTAFKKALTPPPPPPPKKRGSSKGKSGSPAASKVSLQVITQRLPDDANFEPDVGTPPPPPPPKSLGTRRRRRAAANASNKGDESDKDSPVKIELSQFNADLTEKAPLQVDSNHTALEEPLIEVGTSPPPMKTLGSKQKRRDGAQKSVSVDSSIHDVKVNTGDLKVLLEDLEIQKIVEKVARVDTPFDEVSDSSATDTLAIQLAAAKIVDRQLSPASETRPGYFDEIGLQMTTEHEARPFDEVSASDTPNASSIKVVAGHFVARQLPSAPEHPEPFEELSSSDAIDNSPMQIVATKLVQSHLLPTPEKDILSLGEMQVSSPPTSSAREVDSPKVSSPSTDSIDKRELPEMTRPWIDSIGKNEAPVMGRRSIDSIGEAKAPEMASSPIDSIDESEASKMKTSSMDSVDEIASPTAANMSSRSAEILEMACAVLARKREANSSHQYEDSLTIIESNDQELQYLAKVHIVASEDSTEQEGPLSSTVVAPVALPTSDTCEGMSIEESLRPDSVNNTSVEESPSFGSPVNGFDEETKIPSTQKTKSSTVLEAGSKEEAQASRKENELVDSQSSEYETFNLVVSKESNEGPVSNILDTEGQDTTNAWDTRSIMEYPIDVSPSAIPDIDSSWDASRMTFTTDEKKSQDDVDIFESVSWSQAGSEFSQSAETTDKTQDKLTQLMSSALESNVMDPASAASSEAPFTEDAWPSDHASKSTDAADKLVSLSLKEEQVLLDDAGRSDIQDGQDEEDGEQLSQVERLELYKNTSYVSSSDDEDDIADDDAESKHDEGCHENSDEEDEEVQYESHNVEVDSDVEELSECEGDAVVPSGMPAATFGASDTAAKVANQEDDSQAIKDAALLVSDPAPSPIANLDYANLRRESSSHTIEGTPSEPRRLGEDESHQIVTSDTSEPATSSKILGLSKAIPLLAPPPEDKLKKWEEQKLRPFKHFEATKAAREKQAADASFADFSLVAKSSRDFALLSESVSNDRLEDGKIVLSDKKIEDKKARASVVTAELLEEKCSADGKGVLSNKGNNIDEDTESDIMQDNTSSMIFCGGAATLHENILSKIGTNSFVVCNPGNSTEESPRKEENAQTSIFSTWKHHPLLRLASEKVAVANSELQVGDRRPDSKEAPTKLMEHNTPITPAMTDSDLAIWLQCLVLRSDSEREQFDDANAELRALLEDNCNFDRLCAFAASKVSTAVMFTREEAHDQTPTSGKVKEILPFTLANGKQRPHVLAANFVSFVQRIGKLTGVSSPFQDENPFLMMLVGESIEGKKESEAFGSMQQLVFDTAGSEALQTTRFFYDVIQAATLMTTKIEESGIEVSDVEPLDALLGTASEKSTSLLPKRQYEIPPDGTPSPFETATWSLPSAVAMLLGFLGDPVAVCRMKMVNRFCNRIVSENEQNFMRDAVRLGGMSMNVRPAFWLWITLEKSCGGNQMSDSLADGLDEEDTRPLPSDISKLAQQGREGNWHGVIDRDVARAFGNMPPHKTGARFRADSIVRALVTYGRGRLIKRGVRGGGEAPPIPRIATSDGLLPKSKPRLTSAAPPPWFGGDDRSEGSDASETPTDTVSDWGCVSPVASFASSVGEEAEMKRHLSRRDATSCDAKESITEGEESDAPRHPTEELALSGNTLTNEMKTKLQNQLEFILHALAAEHNDVGYCQGMDYVVAHLLRILQDTVIWQAAKGSLPAAITGTGRLASLLADDSVALSEDTIAASLVVEEAVFRVMDCFFTTYNLRHMYWPELRQLKICCRVFERLIQHKLPVLADHFEHHELNVGLFALGWFQTLYLYLPSMPAATVCHMWDIWLVERSFKIFFRVGTAILFLSQPLLLNHDLEGMMTYLNTFPDATLLKPDILIACALQIKVTNRMLKELEMEVTGGL